MLRATYSEWCRYPYMLSVTMLIVVILRVMTPFCSLGFRPFWEDVPKTKHSSLFICTVSDVERTFCFFVIYALENKVECVYDWQVFQALKYFHAIGF